MEKSFIIYASRTPMGKIGGALAPVRIDDLLAHLLAHYAKVADHPLELIDDCIVGCAGQAGEDNRNLARMSAILAGFPLEVPATTVNRLCGSSLDAAMGAFSRIGAGQADCIIVGGAESMSRAPWVIGKTETPFGRNAKMYDSSFGWRFPNPKMKEMFPLYSMGETAEEIGKIHNISRKEQDAFALSSHQKAATAWDGGAFKQEVIPVNVTAGRKNYLVEQDECVRKDTSMEKLAKLKAVFREGGSVTAGNSSPMNDGAALLVVVSEKFLKQHKLKPLARITGAAVRGLHPNTMGLGPVVATKLLCEKTGQKVSDFDIVELNEAFAIQSLACIKELGLDESRVNKNGGAIALGHPLGCSGARILTTLTHLMAGNSAYKKGLATMCIGVGQGIALSVENCI